jgi:hypothetical protein
MNKGETNISIEEAFSSNFLEEYLTSSDPTLEDIPRFTKIALGTSYLLDNNKFIIGQEIGAFKGGTTADLSTFGFKYEWLLVGSKPYLFYLLITGGVILCLLIVILFSYEIVNINSSGNNFAAIKKFLFICFLLILFYNDSFRNNCFLILFVYLVNYPKIIEEWSSKKSNS